MSSDQGQRGRRAPRTAPWSVRQPAPWAARRAARRAAMWATGAILLVLALALPRLVPAPDRIVTHVSTGGMNQPVRSDIAELTVTSARLADAVTVPVAVDKRLRSRAVWVVVQAEGFGVQYPVLLNRIVLQSRADRRYRPSRLTGLVQLDITVLQPRILSRGMLVFEVPRDELDGIELVAGQEQEPNVHHLPLAVVAVPLPVTSGSRAEATIALKDAVRPCDGC